MPKGIKEHYRRELDLYKTEFAQENLPQAWYHLERARILDWIDYYFFIHN